jgi:hypothetical protein
VSSIFTVSALMPNCAITLIESIGPTVWEQDPTNLELNVVPAPAPLATVKPKAKFGYKGLTMMHMLDTKCVE